MSGILDMLFQRFDEEDRDYEVASHFREKQQEAYNDRVCQRCKVGHLHWVNEGSKYALYTEAGKRHVCPPISAEAFDIVENQP